MSAQTVEELRKKEDELAQEIAERQQLIEAYRRVREDLSRKHGGVNGAQEPDDNLLLVPHHGNGTVKEVAYGDTTRLIRSAISKMTSNYTIRDLHQYLRVRGYQTGMVAIANVLMRLKKSGEIKEAEPGRGRRPAVFRRST